MSRQRWGRCSGWPRPPAATTERHGPTLSRAEMLGTMRKSGSGTGDRMGTPGSTLGAHGRDARARSLSEVNERSQRAKSTSEVNEGVTVKALVYGGPGIKTWQDVPDPEIVEATDAIVRVDKTTICGTDLHILEGDVPAVQVGRILGHEGVGTITAVGSSVSSVSLIHISEPTRR